MFGELGLLLLTIESPVAQWLEHPTRSRRVVGSNPIWGSDFFRVLQTFNLSILALNIYLNVQFRATYRHVESQVLLSQDLFGKIALN